MTRYVDFLEYGASCMVSYLSSSASYRATTVLTSTAPTYPNRIAVCDTIQYHNIAWLRRERRNGRGPVQRGMETKLTLRFSSFSSQAALSHWRPQTREQFGNPVHRYPSLFHTLHRHRHATVGSVCRTSSSVGLNSSTVLMPI